MKAVPSTPSRRDTGFAASRRHGPRGLLGGRGRLVRGRRGETLGIIGHNGAGKSTILKLLSRITAPTSGTITLDGRLAALIEVGSGFHPELTGRENVFLSGSVLGMRRREIAAKLDRIVEFAGVGPFIDTPVKWYSSGMFVRLGFAVAAHLEADILLVDEVLGGRRRRVPDPVLRADRRAAARWHHADLHLARPRRRSRSLCDRVVLMNRGRLIARRHAGRHDRAVPAAGRPTPSPPSPPTRRLRRRAGAARVDRRVLPHPAGADVLGTTTGGPLRRRRRPRRRSAESTTPSSSSSTTRATAERCTASRAPRSRTDS